MTRAEYLKALGLSFGDTEALLDAVAAVAEPVRLVLGLAESLAPLVGRSQADTLAEQWAAQKPDVDEQVNKILATAGLSMDSPSAASPVASRNSDGIRSQPRVG